MEEEGIFGIQERHEPPGFTAGAELLKPQTSGAYGRMRVSHLLSPGILVAWPKYVRS
jgi:hypothetical protein